MKNLTDLPQGTSDEIREKIHCYLSERHHVIASIDVFNRRVVEIDTIVSRLIDESAAMVLKKHKITPVRLSLK
jgi:hypothetical protein